MNKRVSLIHCDQYAPEAVDEAVRRAVDLVGGMNHYVRPGQQVLLKANLLRSAAPEQAVSTHPAVVRAVARLVIEAGGKPVIGDSPGGPFVPAMLRSIYQRSGMQAVAQETGAELNLDVGEERVAYPEGRRIKALEVCTYVSKADVVISLAKLKTHGFMHLTGATKNMYGAIPGLTKLGYHAKFPDPALFGDMLIDVLDIVRPALSIVDGVMGMDGDGPSAGDPFPVGAILAGADALAVDLVAAELVGMDPHDVFVLRAARERGRVPARAPELDLAGDPLDTWQVSGFRVPDAYREPRLLVRTAGKLVKRWMVAVPRANERCIRCGICVRSCPVEAITLNGDKAEMDLDTCIRCYCCHEMCPERAIDLHKPLLARLLP